MRVTGIAVLLALVVPRPTTAQAVPNARYVRAFGTLYTTTQLGGLVKAWCDERAPETRAATDTALATWKATYQLNDIEARAEAVLGAQLSALKDGVLARRASVFRSLDKDSRSPETDCRQMLAYLNRSANPERLHPGEFRLVAAERARTAANTTASTAPSATPAPPATRAGADPLPAGVPTVQGRGTVYSVAQLSALVSRDHRTAEARLKRMGPLTVQGTLETYDETRPDETVWLNTLNDGWRSTVSVLCYDLSFRKLYNANRRAITLRGTVRSVESWIQLENCQVVTDTERLVASTVSDSGGLRRLDIAAQQLRTAPNEGLRMADIEGVYQPTKLRYNPMSMLFEPDETTYLVLNDGWVYDNLSVSPHDLNVTESRRLEPQHWHRWRRRGAALELQTFDEFGRTDGKWEALELVARPTIGARRLNGVFVSTRSATAGLPGVGGATSIGTTSYTFRPDGTFSWTNFTQNFASSNTGTGAGGGSIAVGGAMIGPNGTSISAVGGGEDEGTYTTDGYTLELRTRKGEVFRFPIFSWDTGKYRNYLVINGTSYSPPK
jgi:hypothetical protein